MGLPIEWRFLACCTVPGLPQTLNLAISAATRQNLRSAAARIRNLCELGYMKGVSYGFLVLVFSSKYNSSRAGMDFGGAMQLISLRSTYYVVLCKKTVSCRK
jgi:hypothetical protein